MEFSVLVIIVILGLSLQAVNSMPLNHRNIKEEYLPSSMSHVDIESEDDLNIVYEDLVVSRPSNFMFMTCLV